MDLFDLDGGERYDVVARAEAERIQPAVLKTFGVERCSCAEE